MKIFALVSKNNIFDDMSIVYSFFDVEIDPTFADGDFGHDD